MKFNNDLINFQGNKNSSENNSIINNNSLIPSKISSEGISVDDITDSSIGSKINLGQVKDKKNFTGDRNFILYNEKQDYSNIKSKIDTTLIINKDISNKNDLANEELARKYQELQKEKESKLKDYRDLILKMKKDKRTAEKEKEKEDLFEINENQLSDDVKKRINMRKQLADKLKK